MDWSQSYAASLRVFRVNRDTWADAEQIENVDSIEVSRTSDGELLESGGMDITGEFDADYYRIVLTAVQDDDVERVDVATMLFDTNSGEVNRGTKTQSAEGFSVLYPASKTTLLAGEYAPAGVDGAEYAAELLRAAINAPVEVDGHFTLNGHIVHEIGSSVLEAAWAVLNAGNFCMQIDGRGMVHILPMPTEPAVTIDTTNAKLLTPGIKYDKDMSEIPNRYIVLNGDMKTVAVNDDPDSPVSTVMRGYFVDYVDESPTPVNGETMGEYAVRMLKQKSVLNDNRAYQREYAAGVNPYSIVRASIDGLDGDLRVHSQSIKCEHGITIEEQANREVKLWQ